MGTVLVPKNGAFWFSKLIWLSKCLTCTELRGRNSLSLTVFMECASWVRHKGLKFQTLVGTRAQDRVELWWEAAQHWGVEGTKSFWDRLGMRSPDRFCS